MPSVPAWRSSARLVRMRNRVWGLDRYREPRSYFEPGGFDAAAATCAAANRDLLAFVRPLDSVEAENLRQERAWTRRDGVRVEAWSFDSPVAVGPEGQRPRLLPAVPATRGSTFRQRGVVPPFPLRQELAAVGLVLQEPDAAHAGRDDGRPTPLRANRTGTLPPASTRSVPTPAEIYKAMRQWCWDHHATVDALRRGGRCNHGRDRLQPWSFSNVATGVRRRDPCPARVDLVDQLLRLRRHARDDRPGACGPHAAGRPGQSAALRLDRIAAPRALRAAAARAAGALHPRLARLGRAAAVPRAAWKRRSARPDR